MDNPELRELVDAPRERLDVEYKSWLDLAFRAERQRIQTIPASARGAGSPNTTVDLSGGQRRLAAA